MSTAPIIEPAKVIAGILQEELGLSEGLVMLANQKYNIPTSKGLYIVVTDLGGKVISSGNELGLEDEDDDESPTVEVQSVTELHVIQIDMMSFDGSARARQHEVAMAMGSIHAQQQMDANGIQLGRLPSEFLDASSLEETARLNRYTTTVTVTALHRKTKAAKYYDTFPTPEVHHNV